MNLTLESNLLAISAFVIFFLGKLCYDCVLAPPKIKFYGMEKVNEETA